MTGEELTLWGLHKTVEAMGGSLSLIARLSAPPTSLPSPIVQPCVQHSRQRDFTWAAPILKRGAGSSSTVALKRFPTQLRGDAAPERTHGAVEGERFVSRLNLGRVSTGHLRIPLEASKNRLRRTTS